MAKPARSHWLVKSEPSAYAWQQLVADKSTCWSGVRNFTARNNLAAMKRGDLVLFYHSGEGKHVVGVAKLTREAYADPTAAAGESWVAVDLAPVKRIAAPVTLAQVKADAKLRDLALVKQSRLSVVPIAPAAFERILQLGNTKL